MGKIKDFFKKLGGGIWDFISDKNNSGDEKRILGIISVGLGFWYGFTPGANQYIMTTYLAFGGALLGVASLADKIPMAKG